MNEFPYFPFYPADYETDEKVKLMSLAGEGCYLRLLCHQWKEGSIPADRESVVRLCKGYDGPGIDEALTCFIPTDKRTKNHGRLINKRLMQERIKLKEFRQVKQRAGLQGAEKRWREDNLIPPPHSHTPNHAEYEWQLLIQVCGNKCVRCGVDRSELIGKKLTKDHIIPRHMGGDNSINNIQPLCRNCNSSKTKEMKDYRPEGWMESIKSLLSTTTNSLLAKNSKPINSPLAKNASSSSSSSSSSNKNKSRDLYIAQIQPEFNQFWESYPNKEAKDVALAAFQTLRKKESLETIARAFNGYMDFLKNERVRNNFDRRPMNASTFLRKNRWKDFLDFKYEAPL